MTAGATDAHPNIRVDVAAFGVLRVGTHMRLSITRVLGVLSALVREPSTTI
jgi:hypothetical protein